VILQREISPLSRSSLFLTLCFLVKGYTSVHTHKINPVINISTQLSSFNTTQRKNKSEKNLVISISDHQLFQVADRSMIRTTPDETQATSPPGLQAAIDSLVSQFNCGRSFVRYQMVQIQNLSNNCVSPKNITNNILYQYLILYHNNSSPKHY